MTRDATQKPPPNIAAFVYKNGIFYIDISPMLKYKPISEMHIF